tara:strand:+ start:201 stop:758 length:558 start_codon:yes stop_codon:yes gene_type:complete
MIKKYHVNNYEAINKDIIERINKYNSKKEIGYGFLEFDIFYDFDDLTSINILKGLFIENAFDFIGKEVEYKLDRGWIHADWVDRNAEHLYQSGQFNQHRKYHDHIDIIFKDYLGVSCVYYLDSSHEQNGEAVLQYEHEVRGIQNIKSKTGDMLIFPNELIHSASATKSSEQNPRYSISTNVRWLP